MAKLIPIIGIDAAFANMGLCIGDVDVESFHVEVRDLVLIKTEAVDQKEVRKSSNELRRARELVAALRHHSHGCVLAFAEVPSGSQSASAARALGIAVGALASCPIPLVEVSQREVKMAAIGKQTAKKDEIINWAVSLHPDAPWRRIKRKGAMELTADNEHLADARAAIAAGLKTEQFKQAVAMWKNATGIAELAGAARTVRRALK